jgi:hypothetical protein
MYHTMSDNRYSPSKKQPALPTHKKTGYLTYLFADNIKYPVHHNRLD